VSDCKADEWNRAEIGLLIVSLTITGMTTCLIATGLHSLRGRGLSVICASSAAALSCEAEANDLHWAKSALTQRVLVFLICAIAGDARPLRL